MQNLIPDHHIQLIVHCAQGQTILIGPDIAVKVNNTYLRKHDRRSCVSLTIEAPLTTSIYQTCVNLKKPDALPSDNAGEAANVSFNSITKEPPASSAAQTGTESAHSVNTAQTQYVQGLPAQNALEASSASHASDTVKLKSNRAGKASVSQELTTPQGHRPTLTIKPARKSPQDVATGKPAVDASQDAFMNDAVLEHLPLQTPKKPRASRKKASAAQVTAEVLA